jgi:sporulation integral membrane protein YlbJ
LGTAGIFSRIFCRPLAKIYRAPRDAGYVFFMSALSGYPVGAKLTADLYEHGLITQQEASGMASFTSTAGPIFLIGAVGSSMFGSVIFGYLLVVTHLFAALLNGLLYRTKAGRQTGTLPVKKDIANGSKTDNILSEIIYDSVISVLVVGGYIALFNMLADVLFDLGVIHFLAYLPAQFLYAIGSEGALAQGFIMGLFEVVRGTRELSAFGGERGMAFVLAACLISFGGLSVIIQSVTFLSKAKVKPAKFLLMKLTHALIAVLIAVPLSLLL